MASWCPKCGYYPSLESEDIDRMPWRNAATAPDEEAGSDSLLHALPVWLWVMLGGTLAIFGASVWLSGYFERDNTHQSVYAWAQLIAGAVSALGAHTLAALHARKSDRRLGFTDALVSWVAVWQPTVSVLPKGSRRVCSLVWGVTAVLTAILIIGGQDTSFFFPKIEHKKAELPNPASAAAAAAKKNAKEADSLEESLQNVGNPEDFEDDGTGTDGLKPGQQEIKAMIFGVQTDRRGAPLRFLLCGTSKTRVQYLATISAETISREELKVLVQRLHRTNRSTPAVTTIHSAVWVEPRVVCRIGYSALAGDGSLVNARFAGLAAE